MLWKDVLCYFKRPAIFSYSFFFASNMRLRIGIPVSLQDIVGTGVQISTDSFVDLQWHMCHLMLIQFVIQTENWNNLGIWWEWHLFSSGYLNWHIHNQTQQTFSLWVLVHRHHVIPWYMRNVSAYTRSSYDNSILKYGQYPKQKTSKATSWLYKAWLRE